MASASTLRPEEREARQGLGLKEAFLGKGNLIRFVIAFVIFLLQQWAGQNSVGYALRVGLNLLLFSDILRTDITLPKFSNPYVIPFSVYGSSRRCIIRSVTQETRTRCSPRNLRCHQSRRHGHLRLLLRRTPRAQALPLHLGHGMGSLFFIIGAILKTHPPPKLDPNATTNPSPPPASQAMAAMMYIYVCFYSMGWGPLPWVYCSDIFPTRTRHYGLALASASQWLECAFRFICHSIDTHHDLRTDFVVSKVTPEILTALQYKIFFMFGTINIAGMAYFAFGDMDVIFGSVTAEERQAAINRQEKALDHNPDYPDVDSKRSDSVEKACN
ncbi:substrate transporter [Salix suchowensis]|nr:substrate transporter [Salix suchowensis]